MGKRSIIPYGPQHPVLPEPIHLDLVVEDERIIEAIPSIGFVHRGLESLITKKDYNAMVYVVERTCGICSFMHGMTYCEGIEQIMNIEVPGRAMYLRTIWGEMSRIHSHLLWLGLLADGYGFESLFYQTWRIREKVLDIFEATTGGRVIFSVNKVGGCIRDMNQDKLNMILRELDDIEKKVKEIQKTFLFDYSVQSRLKGIGILTKEQVHDLSCVGPFARASGLDMDMRYLGKDAYKDLEFHAITSNDGDCYARCEVRVREIFQSIDLIREAIGKIPDGEIDAPVKGLPNGETFMRVEQPRGEAIYYIKTSGKAFVDRLRIGTPTFANLPGLCETLKGANLADVGLLVLSIDPCISCTER